MKVLVLSAWRIPIQIKIMVIPIETLLSILPSGPIASKNQCSKIQHCLLLRVYCKGIMGQYSRMGRQVQAKHTQWRAVNKDRILRV